MQIYVKRSMIWVWNQEWRGNPYEYSQGAKQRIIVNPRTWRWKWVEGQRKDTKVVHNGVLRNARSSQNIWHFGQLLAIWTEYFGQILVFWSNFRYADVLFGPLRPLCSTFNCFKTPAGCVPLCTHLELSIFYNGSCGIMNTGEEYHTKVQVTKEGNLSRWVHCW